MEPPAYLASPPGLGTEAGDFASASDGGGRGAEEDGGTEVKDFASAEGLTEEEEEGRKVGGEEEEGGRDLEPPAYLASPPGLGTAALAAEKMAPAAEAAASATLLAARTSASIDRRSDSSAFVRVLEPGFMRSKVLSALTASSPALAIRAGATASAAAAADWAAANTRNEATMAAGRDATNAAGRDATRETRDAGGGEETEDIAVRMAGRRDLRSSLDCEGG